MIIKARKQRNQKAATHSSNLMHIWHDLSRVKFEVRRWYTAVHSQIHVVSRLFSKRIMIAHWRCIDSICKSSWLWMNEKHEPIVDKYNSWCLCCFRANCLLGLLHSTVIWSCYSSFEAPFPVFRWNSLQWPECASRWLELFTSSSTWHVPAQYYCFYWK